MKFLPKAAFARSGYSLLPFRFRRLPWDSERVVATSASGEWLILQRSQLDQLAARQLDTSSSIFADLEARNFVTRGDPQSTLAPLLSQIRTRKAFLAHGPALHLFVVTMRCHHSCAYCQVSRKVDTATQFDMASETAASAVDRLFEWPAKALTVEFQGGEPLLHFDRIRQIVDLVVERNMTERRDITFVIAATLHDMTDAQLDYCAAHRIRLSTSLDGPEWLHNANRPRPERDSYRRTIEAIDRARRRLGEDAVSALTTLTRRSLTAPTEIVDEYKRYGFRSIFLRPLSPYGFARKGQIRLGYPINEYLSFYRIAIDHIFALNRSGYSMEEVYASLVLRQLLTPFSHGYVDLRSPTGAGLGAVVYDYDGRVYPSDEARMLTAMGDDTFAMGTVDQPIRTWLASAAMSGVLNAGVAEALPTCSDCAYVAMCGADPIDHYARQGDLIGHRPTSDFCRRNMSMFDLMLELLETGSDDVRGVLEGWALGSRGPSDIQRNAAA